MPIEFPCPQCGRTLRTPDGSAGKRAKCPSCEMVTSIPATSAPAPAGGDNPFGGSSGGGQSGNPFSDSSRGPAANPFADSTSRPNVGGFDDPLNPYASPSTVDERVATSGGELQRRKVDFGETISVSWNIFSNHFGMMLVAGLLFLLISFGWNILSSIVVALLQAALGVAMGPGGGPGAFGPGGNQGLMNNFPALVIYIIIQIVATVLQMAVYAWLQCGMLRFLLAASRGRPPEINLLFSSGNYVLRMIGFSLLTSLILYGVALIGAIPGYFAQDWVVAMIGAGILGLIAAIGLFLFMFTPMFIVDRNEGVIEAMKSSWHYMSNNFLTVFAVLLVMGIASLIPIVFTCGIGYIGAIPFLFLLTVVMYLMATGQMIRR